MMIKEGLNKKSNINDQGRESHYEKYVKRLLDIMLSLAAIVVLSPVFIIIAFLVRKNLGKPVLFMHERPGLNEEVFTLFKFRTMSNHSDEHGKLLPDNIRLTRFGRFLRSTSLDELPELLNILKGDMSIVGPRPLAIQYLPYYSENERMRHKVRPGLTGLAQINGRNAISWEERFEYDISYVNTVSFLIDVEIIFKTIFIVLKRSNIGQGEDSPESLDDIRKREHYDSFQGKK